MSEPIRFTSYQENRRSLASTREEPDISADPDPSRLSSLLQEMDQIKQEIHDRMRRKEAFKQANNPVREDAAKTEALTSRIAEIQKAIRMAQPEVTPENPKRPNPILFSPLQDHHRSEYREYEPKDFASLDSVYEPKYADSSLVLDERIGMPKKLVDEIDFTSDPINSSAHGAANGSDGPIPESSAQQLLAQAETALTKVSASVEEAKLTLEQSIARLNKACEKEEQAASDFRSSQQELTTAYQFAAAATQREKDASLYYRKATLWALGAAVLAWIAAAWIAWASFHAHINILIPAGATVLILGIGSLLPRWINREE